MATTPPSVSLLLITLPSLVLAADNGFDSSMDMPMSLASGSMLTYLHFTPGDVLWFDGWVPGRGCTLFAACVGLFLLGLAERWATALRAGLDLALVKNLPMISQTYGPFFVQAKERLNTGKELYQGGTTT
ncbi:hypothetical protein H0H92_016098 [Tricholoma furcatifolium]|nr:hypothetical protein H0H92_016098 [Tricholoma furcatifolium]